LRVRLRPLARGVLCACSLPTARRQAVRWHTIGEADDVAARLRIHVRSADKDFFDRLAIVVSSDNNLTKAHARYLESRVIRMARQAGAVALANGTDPDFQRLPEADRADMQFFSDQLSLLLPLAGFGLFHRTSSIVASSLATDTGGVVLTFSTAGATATGRETDDGFVVLAARRPGGSRRARFLRATWPCVNSWSRMASSSPDRRRSSTPSQRMLPSSPSAATSIVAARSASGPREWRVKETGQLYGEWRAERLSSTSARQRVL
jgi:hypothetical protein